MANSKRTRAPKPATSNTSAAPRRTRSRKRAARGPVAPPALSGDNGTGPSSPKSPEAGSAGWLVVKYAANEALVVQDAADAVYQEAIIGALTEARTYGEFRRMLPAGEWDEVIDRLHMIEEWEDREDDWLDDKRFDWNTPFDSECVSGFSEGDYPAWSQAELDEILPKALLRKYATRAVSVHNGGYWHIPHESAPALIADLQALGFHVDDEVNFLRGW